MFTPKYYPVPLRLGPSRDFSPAIPHELEKYFDIAQRVARYNFTESDINFIFQDNVAIHTIRLVNYLHNLILPDFLDREVIERMLWIHDLPEAVVNEDRGSDYVSHEKNADESLGNLQDSLEERAAWEMFDASDFYLFQHIERAKKKIKTADWSDIDMYKNAIFAKMLDWIESRNKFTYVTTEWIVHPEYREHPVIPPRWTMHLCLVESYQIWMRDFSTIPDRPFRDFMLDFIHDEMYDFHRLRWDAVIARVPHEIQMMYSDFVMSGEKKISSESL